MAATSRRLAVVLVLAASCARTPAPAGVSQPSRSGDSPQLPKDQNVITKAELDDPAIQSLDALTAIRLLRPAFFRQSGPQSFVSASAGQTQLSQDYGPLQPVSQLRWFDVLMIAEVRYLDANDAQGRFGLNANGGPVIVVLSRRQ